MKTFNATIVLAACLAMMLTPGRAHAASVYAANIVDEEGIYCGNCYQPEDFEAYPGQKALGPPDQLVSGWQKGAGFVVLDFGNFLLRDGEGDDLTVYHVRWGRSRYGNPQPQVQISSAAAYSADDALMNWKEVGVLSSPPYGEQDTVRPDSFDFADVGEDNVRHVRILKTSIKTQSGKFIETVKGHYPGGLDPTNTIPEQPMLSLPASGATVASLTPLLETEAFYDEDEGDTHFSTRWQIAVDSAFDTIVYDVETTVHLTALTVPGLLLDKDTEYFWRVQFLDSRYGRSVWSQPFDFTTPDEDPQTGETCDNGSSNCVKIFDSDGQSIGTVELAAVGGNCTIDGIMAVPADEVAFYLSVSGGPEEDGLPLGLIRFRLGNVVPGAEVTVTVLFSEAVPVEAKWFYHDPVKAEWLTVAGEDALFSPDRKSVELTIKDGGPYDQDGAENGIILDPGGPGTAATIEPIVLTISGADADTDAAAGCFIAAASYGSRKHRPPAAAAGLLLPAGLMIIGLIRRFAPRIPQRVAGP
jgi:hypothetical protein